MTGDGYVKMKWQIYSNREKRVVFARTSEGRGSVTESNPDGWLISIQNSFAAAVGNFAADRKFRDFLRKDRAQGILQIRSDPVRDISKIVALPEVAAFTTPIKRNVNRLKVGAVTVSAGAGHGSGFIISEEGLVLTNAHVVGAARFVSIQLVSGREVNGEVLRRNRKRDVALILVEGRGYIPMPIRQQPVDITEEVFAIGTPRSRKLANTVTKGTVSGMRTHPYNNNLEFIQTDTDIHGGSSGGPLVDAKGNVVGIAVAGYMDSENKSSIGLNLFIPILDGLTHLGLEVRKMPKSYSPVKQIQLTEQAGAPIVKR